MIFIWILSSTQLCRLNLCHLMLWLSNKFCRIRRVSPFCQFQEALPMSRTAEGVDPKYVGSKGCCELWIAIFKYIVNTNQSTLQLSTTYLYKFLDTLNSYLSPRTWWLNSPFPTENSDQKRRANFSSMTDSVPFFSALLIFFRLIFLKLTDSCPVAWWYSIVCLLFRISPEEYSAFDFRVGPAL